MVWFEKTILSALCLIVAADAMACSAGHVPLQAKEPDLSWIRSDLTIFGVDERGLYMARLDKGAHTLLVASPKEFKFNRGLGISPDGHWLVYSMSLDNNADGNGRVRRLYDRTKGNDRDIPGLAHAGNFKRYEFLGFSSDSRMLAWQDNGPLDHTRDPGARPRLLVYTADTLALREFPYPPPKNAKGAVGSCFTSQWSPDGRAIYSNEHADGFTCMVPQVDTHRLLWFKTDVANGQVTVLDGHYTYGSPKYAFKAFYKDGGKTLQWDYPCLLHHGCGQFYGDKVVGGTSSAWFHHVDNPSGLIDGPEELYVQAGGNKQRKVDVGNESSCSGSDIEIVGWVDNGNYLLYRLEGNTWIYGVREDRKAPLPQLTGDYNWLPLDGGGRPYNQGGGKEGITVSQMSD